MDIIGYTEDYRDVFFDYWCNLAKQVPYFFPVSIDVWCQCLLNDKIDGIGIFLSQKILLAVENGHIIGFIQYGQPAFAWDGQGKKVQNPHLGLIRHFYFNEGREDAAERLFNQSERFMNNFLNHHAFYHFFGMSCNANHGKLHQNLSHVEEFLKDKGYQIEHENLYYSHEISEISVINENYLQLHMTHMKSDIKEFDIELEGVKIGSIKIRPLDRLTGGGTRDTGYMTWLGIDEGFRRQGWGEKAMRILFARIKQNDITKLHTDTASTNLAAQSFYKKLGFICLGRTRSYIRNN